MTTLQSFKRIPAVLAVVAMSGCVAVDERMTGQQMFAISTPASGFINTEMRAHVILNLRAGEICPKGFTRFAEDRVVRPGGIEFMIWRINCRT